MPRLSRESCARADWRNTIESNRLEQLQKQVIELETVAAAPFVDHFAEDVARRETDAHCLFAGALEHVDVVERHALNEPRLQQLERRERVGAQRRHLFARQVEQREHLAQLLLAQQRFLLERVRKIHFLRRMPRLRKRNAVDDDVDDTDARIVDAPPPSSAVANNNDDAAADDAAERAKIQTKKTVAAKGKKKLDTKPTPAKITSRTATSATAAAARNNVDVDNTPADAPAAAANDATVNADSQKNGRLDDDGDAATLGSLRDAEATNAALDPRFRDESPQRSPTKPALVTDDDERFVAAKAALAALDERAALEGALCVCRLCALVVCSLVLLVAVCASVCVRACALVRVEDVARPFARAI